MNTLQIIFFSAGLILFATSELFRPWYYDDPNTSAKRDAGYHYFQTVPQKESDEKIRQKYAIRENLNFGADDVILSLDSGRLILQRFTLILGTLGLWLLSASRKSRKHWVFGIFSLCGSLFFLVALGFELQRLRWF